MATELLYMSDMASTQGDAVVEEATEENGRTVLSLNQTLFYPQGGGQPYDQGIIHNDNAKFIVEEVRFVDGIVKHIGHFEAGSFAPGDEVQMQIDVERRTLNSRLHSAGHLVDMAAGRMGLTWKPGKGYHFPDGPYVEYIGEWDPTTSEELRDQMERVANEIIQEGAETRIEFMPKEKMSEVCDFVPEYLPEGKPARVVFYGSYGIPCGGTHVLNLKDIGKLVIRKIKNKSGNIQVSYNLG